jgi:hypothetical protein
MRGSLLRTGGSATFFAFGSDWFKDADRASPGCCRLTSCFRSNSDWKTSSASVRILASVSKFVYVSVQVFVGCRTSCVGGELSLVNEPDEGCGEYRDNDGAGDGFLEVDSIAPAMLGFGEGKLPLLEGVRSWTGRGEMGIFQMTASSGNSSSSSSHSASLSLTVLRFASCHDCLLELNDGEGKTSIFRELFRDSVRDCEGKFCVFDGEGDRDERFGAARLMLVSVGAEGDMKPLLICFPGAAS